MANISNYLENVLIDHVFRARPYVAPAGLYVALCTTTPVAGDTGTTISSGGGTGVEVSAGGYARISYGPSAAADWEATQGGTSGASSGTGGATSNNTTITFPTATAPWGVVTGVAVLDAPAGGNMLFFGALQTSRSVAAGEAPTFPANSFVVGVS